MCWQSNKHSLHKETRGDWSLLRRGWSPCAETPPCAGVWMSQVPIYADRVGGCIWFHGFHRDLRGCCGCCLPFLREREAVPRAQSARWNPTLCAISWRHTIKAEGAAAGARPDVLVSDLLRCGPRTSWGKTYYCTWNKWLSGHGYKAVLKTHTHSDGKMADITNCLWLLSCGDIVEFICCSTVVHWQSDNILKHSEESESKIQLGCVPCSRTREQHVKLNETLFYHFSFFIPVTFRWYQYLELNSGSC